ncbi:MAG: CotH kinase family protein [Bacteroidia bacterium]|nr:CotH kinase family protein [Bacteroidia bacterium]
MTRFIVFLFAILLTCGHVSFSQIVLNEICSFNAGNISDDDGDKSDWIELLNEGSSAVNLENYSITIDNEATWKFPPIVLNLQEYLILFASGKNRTSGVLHTNFKLSRTGAKLTLRDSYGTIADHLAVPALQANHSYGRTSDGVANFIGIFRVATPASINLFSELYFSYAPTPVFSIAPGIYQNAQLLTLSATSNNSIYYTTDGSEPNSQSILYSSPIEINSSTVIKAKSFSNNTSILPSDPVGNTYLVNYQQTLPILSISTEPANFFDWNTGIYVSGPNASPVYPYYGSNFWQDWEIPALVEYFETDGTRKISQQVGVSIHGGSSNRSKAMKSLRLTNRDSYGEDDFSYKFFEKKSLDHFKIIVLRNSSGDFNKTHFRDGTLHDLMIGKVNIDLIAYKPSAVFINGAYFGVHNIREKISKHYIEENFGVDKDNIDLLEEDSTVIEGDFTVFNQMHSFITTNNMEDQSNYTTASKMMDVASLTDYYVAETFLSNIDWPYNNVKFWREKSPEAKWRYILNDLDIALGNNGWAPANFDILGRIMGSYGDNNRHVQIFRSLLANKGFKNYFINRYADLVNTIFSSEYLEQHILNTRDRIASEMPLHFSKWGNDMSNWDHEIFQVAMPHVYQRPSFAMEQVKAVFGLHAINPVTLDVWPSQAGIIEINTIVPESYPWTGNYFDGNEIQVTANPKDGFEFKRWISDEILLASPFSPTITVNPDKANKITAVYTTKGNDSAISLFPNPVVSTLQIGFVSEISGNSKIQFFAADGKLIIEKLESIYSDEIKLVEVNCNSLPKGSYMVKVITPDSVHSNRFIKL